MQAQERELITGLFGRLQPFETQPRDGEAEALIKDFIARQPAAPYLLVQTVLVQEQALKAAQERIAELEAQAGAAPAASGFLGSAPKIGPGDWVFTIDGRTRLGGFSRRKSALDSRMGDPAPWRLHDLRRTARSLMSRAGVPADHAERCLGHSMGGIRGTYDRHSFSREKREAFAALAALVERIVNGGASDNIVQIKGKGSESPVAKAPSMPASLPPGTGTRPGCSG